MSEWIFLNSKRSGAVFLALFIFQLFLSCSRQRAYPEPLRIGEGVRIDVKTLAESPKFYTYHYNGKNINFFVLKMNKEVLSFLDACSSCYPSKKGYRFDKGYIICRSCDVRYSLEDIKKGIGGCFPIRITGRLEDGNYLIPVTAIEALADKF